MTGDGLLAEQVAYYKARAPEYDNWWERRAQYELDADLQAQWFADRDAVAALVDGWLEPARGGRVLELACGTGNFTQRLAAVAGEVVAVDAAPETMAIAREKVRGKGNVRFIEADVFSWDPSGETFDAAFFSFWLSHVPPDRFEAFWQLVRRALTPGGTAILVDNKLHDGVWPRVDDRDHGDFVQVRTDLSSGDAHRIVKVYYEPIELEQRLAGLGWDATITSTPRFFVAGRATPR